MLTAMQAPRVATVTRRAFITRRACSHTENEWSHNQSSLNERLFLVTVDSTNITILLQLRFIRCTVRKDVNSG